MTQARSQGIVQRKPPVTPLWLPNKDNQCRQTFFLHKLLIGDRTWYKQVQLWANLLLDHVARSTTSPVVE